MQLKVFLSFITATILSSLSQPVLASDSGAKAKEISTQMIATEKIEPPTAIAANSENAAGAKASGISQAEQERLDTATINASNQINGQKIDAKIMKKPKKGFGLQDLNPMKWLLKPVTDTQKTVVELQKQIVRLEAPIANLQKPMVGLRADMTKVDSRMEVVNQKMNTMHEDINNIHNGMNSVDRRIAHMEHQLGQMYEPIVQLKNPVIALKDPVLGVGNQLTTLKTDLKELKQVVSFTTTAIFAAVLITGILIAAGTPIVALFAWRHQGWIMQKLGREDVAGKAEPRAEPPEEEEKARTNKANEPLDNTKRAA